jgi:hypothetical protein
LDDRRAHLNSAIAEIVLSLTPLSGNAATQQGSDALDHSRDDPPLDRQGANDGKAAIQAPLRRGPDGGLFRSGAK